jgi:hypothetical protein
MFWQENWTVEMIRRCCNSLFTIDDMEYLNMFVYLISSLSDSIRLVVQLMLDNRIIIGVNYMSPQGPT